MDLYGARICILCTANRFPFIGKTSIHHGTVYRSLESGDGLIHFGHDRLSPDAFCSHSNSSASSGNVFLIID